MADFKTHLFWGVTGGTLLALTALQQHQLQPVEAVAVVAAGGVGGVIPDLDSSTGKPLKILFQILSIIIPIALYPHIKPGIGRELSSMLIFFIIAFSIIYYIIYPMIKKITSHRGIMHSIPFAVLCGELGYLVISSNTYLLPSISKLMPFYFGTAVFIGCFIHLVLDEYYSLSFEGLMPKTNNFTGKALSLFKDKSPRITLVVYILMIIAALVIKSHDLDYQEVLGLFKGTHKIQLIKIR